jgi:hypothetical protein
MCTENHVCFGRIHGSQYTIGTYVPVVPRVHAIHRPSLWHTIGIDNSTRIRTRVRTGIAIHVFVHVCTMVYQGTRTQLMVRTSTMLQYHTYTETSHGTMIFPARTPWTQKELTKTAFDERSSELAKRALPTLPVHRTVYADGADQDSVRQWAGRARGCEVESGQLFCRSTARGGTVGWCEGCDDSDGGAAARSLSASRR